MNDEPNKAKPADTTEPPAVPHEGQGSAATDLQTARYAAQKPKPEPSFREPEQKQPDLVAPAAEDEIPALFADSKGELKSGANANPAKPYSGQAGSSEQANLQAMRISPSAKKSSEGAAASAVSPASTHASTLGSSKGAAASHASSAAADQAAASTAGAEAPPPSNPLERRSIWYSAAAALRYVGNLSRDDDVRVRDSDRATSIFLMISCILMGVSLLVPAMAPHRLALIGVCDLLVGIVLVLYIANRFGILNTMAPRQALLSWQLIMGAGFLGIFITANLAILITLIVAQTNIAF